VILDWPHGMGVASISRSISALPGAQLGVGHLRRLAQPGPGQPQRGDDAVGQLHVECDQESVQVGDHGRPQGQTCVNTPILDTLRPTARPHAAVRDSAREAEPVSVKDGGGGVPAGDGVPNPEQLVPAFVVAPDRLRLDLKQRWVIDLSVVR
jgi:hypothetical protein